MERDWNTLSFDIHCGLGEYFQSVTIFTFISIVVAVYLDLHIFIKRKKQQPEFILRDLS